MAGGSWVGGLEIELRRPCRMVGRLGGWHACEYAAKGGHVECLRVARQLYGSIGTCVYMPLPMVMLNVCV